jgi:SAM-dependent methyltransferase
VSDDDASFVREQYAGPDNLRARKSAYEHAEGDDPRQFVFEAVAAAKPRRVLEVGGGEGELAQRLVGELGVELVGIDQSEAMVEIQRAQGIDARVGNVQDLPFADGEFDLVVAAWMLYHVPDLDRGLTEVARVLRPGGVLVAATNSLQHMEELWALAQRERPAHARTFRSENGDAALRRHFAKVARRDARGTVTLDDAAIRRFGASWRPLGSLATMPPLQGPLLAHMHATIFVAEKAVF